MKPIRVLIADDHALVRAGIRALVEKIEGVVVIGEAGKGNEALELVKQLKPNLMLLDITMPNGGGFEVLDQVTKNTTTATATRASTPFVRCVKAQPAFYPRAPPAPNSNRQFKL